LTRRANQRHDAIIAARVIGRALAKPIETGAIQPHAQAQTSGEAEGRQKKMRQFGMVDIPQEAFIAALKVDS
jgi:translation elongation factor EF-4